MRRVVLTTGGTGGHIFPALAVAQEIRKRYPNAAILFLGGEYGPERELADKAGIDFAALPVRGVAGRGFKGLAALGAIARSVTRARRLLREFGPELVIGFGGYASFPALFTALFSPAKTAIHEQNAFPGMVNRLLGNRVDAVFLAMPDVAHAYAEKKCIAVGNPVRESIAFLHEKLLRTGGRAVSRSPGRILVIGGSQGARALNEGIVAGLAHFLKAGVAVRHQTGQADYDRVRTAYEQAGAFRAEATMVVEPFIEDVAKAYEDADLILCRAGATTLAEVTSAGLPAVLVPFPQAARDHQRYNAEYLRDAGAAMMLEQSAFFSQGTATDKLALTALEVLHDKDSLGMMSRKSLELAKPDAAVRLVDELETLLMRKK